MTLRSAIIVRSALAAPPRQNLMVFFAKRNQLIIVPRSGFTLVEILVGAVLLSIVAAGVAVIMVGGNRTSQQAGLQTQLDALIDQDLAAVQTLNDRYTCCPGSCTSLDSTINAAVAAGDCSVNTPGNENYYSPNQTNSDPTAATTATLAFRSACTNRTITDNFITQMPTLPAWPAGTNLTRTTPLLVGTSGHLLQWSYTGSIDGNVAVTRVVNLTPTVAAWCP
ncbi:type II secretion system protein [Synechococcus sp. CS-1328]|uniref:type II secretion system protein n=1 Tax=Synechococcus sp. CS-1328 TaxID=2847976 RepID=UPI00223C4FA3|nr:type II secretion system protein [Synechococcus sp. CS-1328]MCT0224853.1 type II secretion system GspH family protein [Synechococcus sp. CS-1328]